MKAFYIERPGKAAVRNVEKPRPGPGEVLLRISYVGFCGSDLNSYLGRNSMVSYPRIPGHEVSGEVMERGHGVPEKIRTGEKVTVIPYTNCGSCTACRSGRVYACRSNQTLGVQRDGAMQEYMAVPWQKILEAPGLGEMELALVEPLTVGFHGVDRGRVSGTDRVAVIGCGMIGAGAIAAASQRGSSVIAVDVDDRKLELAGALGAVHTVNTRRETLHDALAKITGGDGPEVVVEAAGNPRTYRAAVEEVAFAGRVVCIGYTDEEVSYQTKLFVQKEIDLLGSRNASGEDFRNVIRFLGSGTFPVDRVVTGLIGPDEGDHALRAWAADPGKVMKLMLNLK